MSSGRDGKRQDIQGLRAIAALAVVLFHATSLLPGGFLGVDVFFVISGFIMSQIGSAEIAATGGFSGTRFMLRRLQRVLPPMAVVVLATIAVGSFIDTPSHTAETLPVVGLAALTGWVNSYFLSAATDYFQTFQTNPLLHLWSLAVEIQFYALLAFVLHLGLRIGIFRRAGKTTALMLVTGLTVLSLVASLTVETWGHAVGLYMPGTASFFLLRTRLWEFGLGILAQRVGATKQFGWAAGWRLHALQVIGALLILLGLKTGSDTQLVPGYQAILPCVGAALLMATGENGVVGRLLALRPLTFLGDRSYSIYLWQGPFIVFAAMLFSPPLGSFLGAIASILASIALFGPVEQMFRGSGLIGSGRRSALSFALACGGALTLCVAANLLLVPLVKRFEAPRPLRAVFLDTHCERQRGQRGIAPCVYGKVGDPQVLLLGDSHAGAISQAVIDAAARAGWRTDVATASACSVPAYPEDLAYRPSCIGYAQDVLAYARDKGVRMVIIQQFSAFYVDKLGIGLERWKKGLKQFLSDLTASGIEVIAVGDNLALPIAIGRPLWANRWQVDLAHARDERQALEEAEASAAGEVRGVRYLRARDYLCNGSICPVFDHGAWSYTDTDHLSYEGAAVLSAPIETELRRVAGRGSRNLVIGPTN